MGESKQPPDRHGPDVLRPRPPSPRAQSSVYGELRLEDSRRCSRQDVPTAYMVSPEGLASPHGYSEHARGWATGNDGARAHPDGPWTRLDQTPCRRTVLGCFSVLSLRLLEPGSWTPRGPLTSFHPDLDATALKQGQPRPGERANRMLLWTGQAVPESDVLVSGCFMSPSKGLPGLGPPTLTPCPLPLRPHPSPSGSTGKGVS